MSEDTLVDKCLLLIAGFVMGVGLWIVVRHFSSWPMERFFEDVGQFIMLTLQDPKWVGFWVWYFIIGGFVGW